MSKFVVILLLSTMIAMVLMFLGVPLYLKKSLVQYANPNYQEIQSETEESYNSKINALLQKAGANIEDKEMKQFYQKLVQDYGLDSSSSTAQTEVEGENNNLPDFQKIFSMSLTSPFEEASKNIKDKELAEIYHTILEGLLD